MTAKQDPQTKYAGVCADCGGRAQPRTNWDVIAPSGGSPHRWRPVATLAGCDTIYTGGAT